MRPKYSFFAYNIEDEAVKLVKKKTKKTLQDTAGLFKWGTLFWNGRNFKEINSRFSTSVYILPEN